jgi:hypothetical protein
MSVSAQNAASAIPVSEGRYIAAAASGTATVINPGDYVAFSGQYIVAASTGTAYWKASGLGIAMDRNPAYDNAGRQVINSGVIVSTYGVYRVSANFSGRVNLGVVAFPGTTGSAVNAPSGVTGVGATWGTAAPVSVSGGTAAAPVQGVAQVIGSYPELGLGGTGQLDIRLWPRTSDYY